MGGHRDASAAPVVAGSWPPGSWGWRSDGGGNGGRTVPPLGYREGLKTLGISMTNGFIDYVTLLNERDGGIHGVTLVWEECETVWDATRAVECYERLKAGPMGAAVFPLLGSPFVYALLERATHDQIPLLAGRWAHGRLGWAGVSVSLQPPVNWWSQNTAKIRSSANGWRHGAAQGLKIVHVYHDSDFGRETILP